MAASNRRILDLRKSARFARMVYAGDIKNRHAYGANFPLSGMVRPARGTVPRNKRSETTERAERPRPTRETNSKHQQRGLTKPPRTQNGQNQHRARTYEKGKRKGQTRPPRTREGRKKQPLFANRRNHRRREKKQTATNITP